jgi:hypothetical protein
VANAFDQGFLRDPTGALVVTGGAVGGGSDPLSDGTPGGSLPTQTLWVAGADGSILRGIQVDSGGRQVTRLGDGTNTAEILATPPASDTGQSGLAVRVISQLGAGSGGGGGGAVTQSTGAAATAPWSMRLTDGTSFYDARTIRALTAGDTVTIANPTTNPETGLAKDATLTTRLPAALDADGGLKIHVQNTAVPVSGTFWQATQPVSGTVTANAGTGPFPVSDNGGSITVDAPVGTPVRVDPTGTTTQPVSGTVTATGPLTDTQLRATAVPVSGPLTDTQIRATALPVSVPGSVAVTGTFWQATQPVSGTVTISNPTTNPETGLAKDATLTGGTQKAIVRSATKGTSTAADVTSDATDANTQALHVNLKGTQATVPVTGTFFQATQPVSLATNTPDVTDRAARVLGITQIRGTHANPVSSRLTGLQPNPVLDVRLVEDSLGNKLGQDNSAPIVTVSGAARNNIFSFSSAELTLPTAAAAAQQFSIFHAVGTTQETQLLELRWHPSGVPVTAGKAVWQFQYITAENATPGGTAVTAQELNRGSALSGTLTLRSQPTGAATTTGQIFGRVPLLNFPNVTGTMPGLSQPVGVDAQRIWNAQEQGAIVMRASTAEGLMLSLNVTSALTGAQTGYFSGTFYHA